MKEPTDSSAGQKKRTCKVCNESEKKTIYPEGTLQKGDRGDKVAALQEDLNNSGFDCGEADGIFGDKTAEAVKGVEKQINIDPDGIAWPKVIEALPLDIDETEETWGVHLEKWISSYPANGEYFVEGETIQYTLELVNDSKETITDIEISDPMKGSDEDACVDRVDSIAAGDSHLCYFDHIVTAQDAADSVIFNQAYASWAPDGGVYSDVVPVDTGLESGRYYAQIIEYVYVGREYDERFSISNAAEGSVYQDPTLIYGDIEDLGLEYDWAVDSSVDVWYKGTVTRTGIGKARYTMLVDDNLWTIDIELIAIEDESALSIELLSFGLPEGENTDECAEGKLRITNNGDTKIFVSNYDSWNKNGVIMGEDHFISPTNHSELEPGESMVFTYITYIVEDPDVIDGKIVRDITVFGTEIDGGEEDAIRSNTVHAELALSGTPETLPNVHLEKWISSYPANGEYFVEGETIQYTLELVNDGDEPISDIEISDPMKGSNEDACVDRVESIAAGDSHLCYFDHVVTAQDAADGVIFNQAYASWDPDGGVYSDVVPADTGSESGKYYAKFEDCVFVGGTYNEYFTISDAVTGSVYQNPTLIYGDIDKLGLEYDWHTDSSVEVWYRGTVTQPGIGKARYTMLVDDDLWTIDIVITSLEDGDAEMTEDLHIDLLSFEGEAVMTVGTPVHGEIKVTNFGNDTLKVYTGWIETKDGNFLSGEQFGTYPANAFELAPHDSFNLTFTAIIQEEDYTAGVIERDITMVSELADGSDDTIVVSNTVRASLDIGDEPTPDETEYSLHIDLNYFNPETVMAPGTELTGELTVTNTGDGELNLIGGRITYTDGTPDPGAYFDAFPSGTDKFAPGESFKLGFHAVVCAYDVSDVTRDICVDAVIIGGEDDGKLLESNTVKASIVLENDIVVDTPVENRRTLIVTKEEYSVPAKGYYEKDDIITYRIKVKNNTGLEICDVYAYDCLAAGPVGYLKSLGAGEENFFTFFYPVTEADISEPYLVINYADVVYNLRGVIETAQSNEVRSKVGKSTDPIPPEKPIPPVIGTPVLEGDCCKRRIVERGEEDAAYTLHYCAEHFATQEAVAAMAEAATPDTELAAWQTARELWQSDAEAMYDSLLKAANGPAKMIVLNERVLFNGQIASHEAALNALYPDEPVRVAREIAELYMNRVADLCYELHTAPQDRADDLTIPSFSEGSDAGRNECGFAVTAVNGSDVNYSELLCTEHSVTNTMAQALLTASGNAWTRIENMWYVELRKVYQTLGSGADDNARKALRADQATFENWLSARNALVELLYADQPDTAAQMSAKNVMNRVIEMCGGID